MNLPNSLTLARIAFVPLIIALLYHNQPISAALVFFTAAMLDAVDGFLARKLNQVSDFGKLMDPVADKVLVLSTLLVLIEKGIASSIPVIIIIAREFIVSGLRNSKAAKGIVVQASFYGKVKTVVQILAILLLILKAPFGNEVLWISALISVLSGVDYFGRA